MAESNLSCAISTYSDNLIKAIEKRKEELLVEADHNKTNQPKIHFDNNLTELCQSFGVIYVSNVCPDKCYVDGPGIQVGVVDEASYIDVHLINKDGTGCHDDIPVSVQLVCEHTNAIITCDSVQWNGNIVSYRYIPFRPGKHVLHVKISGINKNLFIIDVGMPLRMKFIPKILLDRKMYQLGGVAIGPNNEIAVIDTKGYQTVSVYKNNNGFKLITTFGNYGSGIGQCYWPIGIVYDNDGNILVTDTGNHRIHKFDKEGKLIKTVGEKGCGSLQFSRPTGIAVNKSGLVYICDRDNNRVQILTSDLEYKNTFGVTGDDTNNGLYNPWDVAFDSHGDVYVVDAGHVCIKRFAPYGVFQTKIGPIMYDSERLQSPEMICIDEYDYIYLTDRVRNEVIVFDTEGRYHTSFGCYGKAKGQFNQPRGITKSKDGTLYVTEISNNRLQMFN